MDVRELARALKQSVEGEVRFDPGSLGVYAMDASNYWQVPIGVVVPKTANDVVGTIAACRKFGVPVVSRGGGTALAGQTCNDAVVIDFSKYMNRILDVAERTARVEPGVVADELEHRVRKHGLTFGPQPATHNHCCFGGMISNNCGGIHAQMNGDAVKNTEAMSVVLYDGTRMDVGWMTDLDLRSRIAEGGRIGEIHRALFDLREQYAKQIRKRYPKIPRRVSGYNLDELLPDKDGRFNLARALVGSEGTLVTMLDITVKLIDARRERVLVVLGFDDVFHAGDAVARVLDFDPVGLEGLDSLLRDHIAKKGGRNAHDLSELPDGEGWLFVEIGSDDKKEAIARAQHMIRKVRARSHLLIADEAEQKKLWEVRESGLGATAFVPGEPDTWPGWEDAAVPPARVGRYLRDFRKLCDRFGYHPSLYGHFGQGCVHCRIDFRLMTDEGVASYRAFVGEAADLVLSYGGSLSGEHGDGQSRAELLPKMFGEELLAAFRRFKRIWDPDWKMNPGKIVDPNPLDRFLKLGGDYHPWKPETHFQYPDDDGDFSRAALRCVGIGKCRRHEASGIDDTMCPSYMVTREEKHSTRGRAHLLWEMLQKGPIEGGWKSEAVKESLDLCLACKGCKGDCPVNVDLATYKAEFLSHYYEGRLRPREAYVFGLIDRWARIAELAPGLVNLATQTPGVRALAKRIANMPQERSIPAFAPRTFRAWHRFHRAQKSARRLVLWPDTFNDHFFPDTLIAATRVLEGAGWRVDIPKRRICCGRPLYDFGMLERAKRYLERVLSTLAGEIRDGTPIVVLEPSCASVFRDELRNLLPHRDDAKKLSELVITFADAMERSDWSLPHLRREAIAQAHCHHKAVLDWSSEANVMEAMELQCKRLDSGCCGMAGSFGFEASKYDVSMKAGERVLLPAVRDAKDTTIIVADGFSCREQVAQATGRQALHLAEVVELAMREGPEGPKGRAEEAIVRARARAVRFSMARTVAFIGAIAGAAFFTMRRRKRRGWRRILRGR